jgi:hypothetical protein
MAKLNPPDERRTSLPEVDLPAVRLAASSVAIFFFVPLLLLALCFIVGYWVLDIGYSLRPSRSLR